ncbi:Carbamoyltransferase HypF [Stieleria maiorica]|uniref:Carbamoyltransferase n=1 Tax=Stieleria maiorica TaxID=2795974 RepID=A0A5B9MMT3_9BACT|nr:carbamoyltransferase HypF [Stieleria maiorica]QEG02254.1 Carbamoyltransferase HypF [Stieleria maiorica]
MSHLLKRIRIRLTGRIQGVGFRPFVWNRASSEGLTGWVRNDSRGVTIEAQGTQHQLDRFVRGLQREMPPLAGIDSLNSSDVPTIDESGFTIDASTTGQHESTPVIADVSVCDQCLAEMEDQRDRRFRYPFINCTNCGPRFTIVHDIPYDRPATTMKSFQMCARCRDEYNDPRDRRFHAQPIACPDCGPQIWFASSPPPAIAADRPTTADCDPTDVVDVFATAIRGGQIIAVKGIGGFHLACDAKNVDAIRTLRGRKGRIDKPFAIMVVDVQDAEAFAEINHGERRLLESPERPIVLLAKRNAGRIVAGFSDMLDAVAPGNHRVGVMLPYSPLHQLLVQACAPLVMTSGNLSDEPIARTNKEAIRRLGPLVDGFLLHDRDIHVVCDDSVVRRQGTSVVPIRRSRGFAPMPIDLGHGGRSVVAIGGEIKSTFCVTQANYAYISQHIGDISNLETLRALKRNVNHYLDLFRVDPQAVAADLHPSYLSTQFADELARALQVPLVRVQHHHAHAVSLMAEQRLAATQPIIACCFDGTGYGTDGAIWGGEFLIANDKRFERAAHLQYFPLPGGDASIKRPYRTALALLNTHGLPWDDRLPCAAHPPADVRRLLKRQLDSNLHCFPTSSVGRLFDAVASLIGIRNEVSFEAQAAIELESLAIQVVGEVDADAYIFPIDQSAGQKPIQIETRDLIESICRDVIDSVDRGRIAAQFHHAVAGMIVRVAAVIRDRTGIDVVGLTGGVFQNALLTSLATERLRQSGFNVLSHTLVPPNDGGLSLGQAMVARNQ